MIHFPTTTPAQPASAIAPVEVVSTAAATIAAPLQRTALKLRSSQLNVLEGHGATFTGTLLENHHSGNPRQVVDLQELNRHGWKTIARARTGAHGRFRLHYVARKLGSDWLRLRFAGHGDETSSHRMLGKLDAFRLAGASWYGGGGTMACGGSLTSSTLGVANKTLPCGTLVTLRYDGRTVRVPVVDRGPYVAGREYDLTEATKRALGFGSTGDVWSNH
jgi:rare lipoprotein A